MILPRLLTGLMACDENGGIGLDGRLPWDCPGDLDHFRQTTNGHCMVMGRRTFESMPSHAFRTKEAIVFSRSLSGHAPNIRFIPSLDDLPVAIDTVAPEKTIFAIGGAELIAQLFRENLIARFILSRIRGIYPADCRLSPEVLNTLGQWEVESQEEHDTFRITTYRNPSIPILRPVS